MPRYTALIDGETGAYGIVFPDLPGCTAMGETAEEALANAAEAMRDWIEVTIESGGAVPDARPLDGVRSDPEVIEALAGRQSRIRAFGARHWEARQSQLVDRRGILSAIDSEASRRKLTRSAFIELMAKHALPELAQ